MGNTFEANLDTLKSKNFTDDFSLVPLKYTLAI